MNIPNFASSAPLSPFLSLSLSIYIYIYLRFFTVSIDNAMSRTHSGLFGLVTLFGYLSSSQSRVHQKSWCVILPMGK